MYRSAEIEIKSVNILTVSLVNTSFFVMYQFLAIYITKITNTDTIDYVKLILKLP